MEFEAALAQEALGVFGRTGLTPSQLADELRASREMIEDLRSDADAMASRIQAGDRARDDVIEECAVAARQGDRDGVEWVRDSLWAAITQRSADCVRRLKTKPLS